MNTPQNQLAQLVLERRKELKISQDELSKLTRVAIRTLRDMEKGTANPSLETIIRIMHVLGMELHFRLRT